jgi:hypothetical protein
LGSTVGGLYASIFLNIFICFRCLKVGGQKVLDDWLKAQEDLIYCVMQNFDLMGIQEEITVKKKTGDLDLVFKKYCG